MLLGELGLTNQSKELIGALSEVFRCPYYLYVIAQVITKTKDYFIICPPVIKDI